MDKEAALKEDFKGQLCLNILNCVQEGLAFSLEEEAEPAAVIKTLCNNMQSRESECCFVGVY